MPDPDPTSEPLLTRLSRSPRALAAGAAVLVVAAVAIVVVLLVSGGSKSGGDQLKLVKVGKIVLPPANVHRQNLEAVYTPDNSIFADPVGEVREARALGFDQIDLRLQWATVAPNAYGRHVPRFKAADPAAYPASGWAIYDEIIRLCKQYHLGVDVAIAPSAPLWATGPGAPAAGGPHPSWNPNPAMFGQFVRAVGTRYSGHFTPKGEKAPLPRVDFWSIWNEPNLGTNLGPENIDHNTVPNAPYRYRLLANAAWTALHATGHGSDTTLIGELAPTGAVGAKYPGLFSVMSPLIFLRALYCVGTNDQPLRGHAATLVHCPASAAASKRFAAENPVLFHATAFADHPYPQGLPPDAVTPFGSQDAELAQLPKLFTTLDRLQEAYGSQKRFDVYDTEYGYETSPPGTQTGTVSPKKAAAWLNWSEYISWRLPRVRSYDQYEFADPAPVPHKTYTRFATGLKNYTGKRLPGWYAFRMPLWLPESHATAGGALEVWGCVRPATTYAMARRAPAEIQFKASSSGAWKTIATVSTRTAHGYFDVSEHFPKSGLVRIRWTPPSGAALLSRTSPITVG